mmetsp:Transcript_13035/g.28793  ORF Transcript_13035/g.28793 Transcript_13035/m.28793 type:complete len:316 (+) Transcript_13035:211-1158(+)
MMTRWALPVSARCRSLSTRNSIQQLPRQISSRRGRCASARRSSRGACCVVPSFYEKYRALPSHTLHYSCITEQQWRLFASRTKARSPYAVLKLRTSASKQEIKSTFRRLAKKYHPDVNTTHTRTESEALMAELVDAYDQLMDDDFGGRIGDSRVALACEIYTIPELRMDRLHDVHSLKVNFVDNGGEISTADESSSSDHARDLQSEAISRDKGSVHDDAAGVLSTHSLIEIEAHPHDSISDLKRQLQSSYLQEWGLSGRRLDRDGIATGWELVNDTDGSILSYHLFLSSYGIKNGDIIHAVVRKYHEVEREAAAK